jgi:hypothetical protein
MKPAAPYNVFYEAAFLMIWTSALVSCSSCNFGPTYSGQVSRQTPLIEKPSQLCFRYLQVTHYIGQKQGVVIQLKLLYWPALLVYLLQLYTVVNMVAKQWGLDKVLAVPLLVASSLQAATAVGAVFAETIKYVSNNLSHACEGR